MYYPNLVQYSTKAEKGQSKPVFEALMAFAKRYGRKVGMLLGIYLASAAYHNESYRDLDDKLDDDPNAYGKSCLSEMIVFEQPWIY
jgi:hypothetical protein